MTGVVIDSSSLFHALTDRDALGDAVRALIPAELHVPSLARYEVLNLLRRAELHGALTSDDAELAVDALGDLALTEWPLAPLAERVWALRRNVTAYDAAFIALAERLQSPLVTQDARLARVPGLRCEVVVPA